jgi:hypothetical protein
MFSLFVADDSKNDMDEAVNQVLEGGSDEVNLSVTLYLNILILIT